MILSSEEVFDMIGTYFECMRNATVAFARQYPQRRHSSTKVFRRLIQRLRTTENVNLPV